MTPEPDFDLTQASQRALNLPSLLPSLPFTDHNTTVATMQVFRKAAPVLARRAIFRPAVQRSFATSVVRLDSHPREGNPAPGQTDTSLKKFEDIKSMEDLMPPGAQPGTVPTDLEQATGLERLEILGKMQGVDIFDMRPLDASRKGQSRDATRTEITLGDLGFGTLLRSSARRALGFEIFSLFFFLLGFSATNKRRHTSPATFPGSLHNLSSGEESVRWIEP
nr:cytochrome c oxidase subunit 4, mitochondrial [Quercus suber]